MTRDRVKGEKDDLEEKRLESMKVR